MQRLSQAISLFREPLGLALSAALPAPRPFSAGLVEKLEEQRPFLEAGGAAGAAALACAEEIIDEQARAENALAAAGLAGGDGGAGGAKNFDGEVVQEQEQEQQQEQQQQQQQEPQHRRAPAPCP